MNSRNKGKGGELEVARIMRGYGYDARRGQQFKGGPDSPDVTGVPGLHIEVKRRESFSIYDSIDQAEHDAADDEIPVVFHRKNNRYWVACLALSEFMKIYKIFELYREQEETEQGEEE